MQVSTSNRLRELRKANGLRLVDAANVVGRDQSVYARYERGDTQVPDDAKLALAARYSVSVAHLMGWDESANGEAA